MGAWHHHGGLEFLVLAGVYGALDHGVDKAALSGGLARRQVKPGFHTDAVLTVPPFFAETALTNAFSGLKSPRFVQILGS